MAKKDKAQAPKMETLQNGEMIEEGQEGDGKPHRNDPGGTQPRDGVFHQTGGDDFTGGDDYRKQRENLVQESGGRGGKEPVRAVVLLDTTIHGNALKVGQVVTAPRDIVDAHRDRLDTSGSAIQARLDADAEEVELQQDYVEKESMGMEPGEEPGTGPDKVQMVLAKEKAKSEAKKYTVDPDGRAPDGTKLEDGVDHKNSQTGDDGRANRLNQEGEQQAAEQAERDRQENQQ